MYLLSLKALTVNLFNFHSIVKPPSLKYLVQNLYIALKITVYQHFRISDY